MEKIKCKSTLSHYEIFNARQFDSFIKDKWYDIISTQLGSYLLINELGEKETVSTAMFNVTFYSKEELREQSIQIIIS